MGRIRTDSAPRKATGPNIDQIMMGSEGTFGILTQVTLKVFKKSAKHRKFSYMFPTWEDGMAAMREVMQGEFGYPSVFRLSDAEETDMMMHFLPPRASSPTAAASFSALPTARTACSATSSKM